MQVKNYFFKHSNKNVGNVLNNPLSNIMLKTTSFETPKMTLAIFKVDQQYLT